MRLRKPKQLLSYLHYIGWRFSTKDENEPGDNVTPDPLHSDFTHLRDIYFAQEPDYSGRFTVPTLYDKKQHKIVSNESSEIIRMLYHEFDDLISEKYKKIDLLPRDLEKQIDETNEWTYNDVNNGASCLINKTWSLLMQDRCIQERFRNVSLELLRNSGRVTDKESRSQEAYEKAVAQLFKSLDRIEQDLSKSPGPYYHGERVTEADVRLYTVSFNPVQRVVPIFNIRRL